MLSYILKIQICLFLCLFFYGTANGKDLLKIVTTEIPPYTGDGASTSGFLSEVVREAFKAGRVDIEMLSLPWGRAKWMIQKGKADAIFPINHSEIADLGATKALLYKTTPLVFVKQIGKSIAWNGYIDSLRGHRIGTVRAFAYTDSFDKSQDLRRTSSDSVEQNIKRLLKNRIDMALMDELTAKFYMDSLDKEKILEILSPPLINSSEFYMGFSPIDKLSRVRKVAFVKGLAAIENNGVYKKILDKYGVNGDIRMRDHDVDVVMFADKKARLKPKGSGVKSKVRKSDIRDISIGFVGFHWSTDGYQQSYKQVLEESARSQGFKLINYDAKASLDTQMKLIRDLIKKNVDVICVWPVHGKKILPVLEEARKAGIPTLIVNTPVDTSGFKLVRGYVGPNNVEGGRLAAQMMIEALGGKGKVVEIQGFPGYTTAIERSLGFHDEFKKQKALNPDITIEVIDVIAGYWSREKAYEAAKRLARRIEHFDGLYVADDNMGIGALKALREVNRLKGVKITSATLFGDGYDAIKAGKIYGSVWQDPAKDARIAVETALKIAKHQPIEFFNFFETPKITKRNVDSISRPPF